MKIPNRPPDRINERGNYLFKSFVLWDRYRYDFKLCKTKDDWIQYDTEQDAWYFGIWVNVKKHLVVTYAEGDETICYCHDDDGLRAELKVMEEFYGSPPPAAIGIDLGGKINHYFDSSARPEI